MLTVIKLRILRLRDDYLVFIIMTAMALGLTAVFGASMGSYKPTVLIVNEDDSLYSQRFVEELREHSRFNYSMSPYEEALQKVDEGNALTAIKIKKDFGKNVISGKDVEISLIKTRDDIDISMLENIILETANKNIGNIKITAITSEYIRKMKENIIEEALEDRIYNKVVDNWRYRRPIEIKKGLIDASNTNTYNNLKHSVIGFSIFFSTYTIVFGIGTILNDRQYHTWQRMLISPLSKSSILGGSLIVTFLMGGVQLGILILAGKYLFKIDWGSSISGILTIVGAFIFAVTCLGLLLSGLVKTHSQLAAISPVVLTSTAMLGGCMWPLDIVNSRILLFLANLTPQKWAVEGMTKIATYGYGFEAAIIPSVVLILMGVFFFGIGVKLVKFE